MEKKTSCLLCVLTALFLAVLYLWAALRPGVWLRDAFLYRQADGSFSGKDAYAAYTMRVAQTENGAEVDFTMDGETRSYRLESKAEGMSDPGVKIEQDGVVIFTGTALGDPGDAILWREDDGDLADEVNVIVNGEYQRSDLWPSCNWLYNVAVGGRRETRGSVAFLFAKKEEKMKKGRRALALLLFLDIRFPLLFWNLRHGLEVYGGEPTDWYYAMQRVSRITSIIGVFVLAAMSFAVH